ncbi:MAG TPA: YncE family protein [Terriglobales bacterium]|nr:YncE family protein [Terriglobales bacterium]
MIFSRLNKLAATLVLIAAWSGCGDTFRPVAIPITPNPPNPAAFHYMLVLTQNGTGDPGAGSRIDVSGDTNVGNAKLGLGPVHATLLPNGTRIYATNMLEDTVSSYAPGTPTTVTTIALPQGSVPVFAATTQNDFVFVANSGSNTVSAISTASNVVVTNPAIPVGVSPIALVELPNASKLYSVNQGSGDVTAINAVDRTAGVTIATGSAPVWAIARSDSARVYVLNSGSGTVSTIDTTTDTNLNVDVSVGAGANYMAYDRTFNRLYVTNPAAGTVSAFDVSSDPPKALSWSGLAIKDSLGAAAVPASIAVLPNGTRAYIASATVSGTPLVTIINTSDGSQRSVISLSRATMSCTGVRFSLFAAADPGGTRVYVGNCSAGNTSIINTLSDSLVLNLPAPPSAAPPPVPGAGPPPQNPVFIMTGS